VSAERAKLFGTEPMDPALLPRVPRRLDRRIDWLTDRFHDATEGRIAWPLYQECRRVAASLSDIDRAAADVRRSEAAVEAAQAQTRMAEVLAQVEHGGAALVMLQRLQESLQDGKGRKPLPGRVIAAEAQG